MLLSVTTHHGDGMTTDDLFDSHDAPPARPAPPASPKPPTLYVINANARKARCSGDHCDAVIYWVPGRAFPISADCPDGLHPNAPAEVVKWWTDEHEGYAGLLERGDGLGISHYKNCPDAAAFSRKGKGSRRG